MCTPHALGWAWHMRRGQCSSSTCNTCAMNRCNSLFQRVQHVVHTCTSIQQPRSCAPTVLRRAKRLRGEIGRPAAQQGMEKGRCQASYHPLSTSPQRNPPPHCGPRSEAPPTHQRQADGLARVRHCDNVLQERGEDRVGQGQQCGCALCCAASTPCTRCRVTGGDQGRVASMRRDVYR